MSASLSPDLVQQQGLAQHWIFPQCDEQWHPAVKPASRPRPHKVWHHCLQSPAQPHQGAAVTGRIVSITVNTGGATKQSNTVLPFLRDITSHSHCFLCSQDDDISGCAGFHLRDLCDVLRPCQFCGVPHPGESEQGQTHAVHQRSSAFAILACQLCLGYGKTFQTSCTCPN